MHSGGRSVVVLCEMGLKVGERRLSFTQSKNCLYRAWFSPVCSGPWGSGAGGDVEQRGENRGPSPLHPSPLHPPHPNLFYILCVCVRFPLRRWYSLQRGWNPYGRQWGALKDHKLRHVLLVSGRLRALRWCAEGCTASTCRARTDTRFHWTTLCPCHNLSENFLFKLLRFKTFLSLSILRHSLYRQQYSCHLNLRFDV